MVNYTQTQPTQKHPSCKKGVALKSLGEKVVKSKGQPRNDYKLLGLKVFAIEPFINLKMLVAISLLPRCTFSLFTQAFKGNTFFIKTWLFCVDLYKL